MLVWQEVSDDEHDDTLGELYQPTHRQHDGSSSSSSSKGSSRQQHSAVTARSSERTSTHSSTTPLAPSLPPSASAPAPSSVSTSSAVPAADCTSPAPLAASVGASVTPAVGWLAGVSSAPCESSRSIRSTGFGRKRPLASTARCEDAQQQLRHKPRTASGIAVGDVQSRGSAGSGGVAKSTAPPSSRPHSLRAAPPSPSLDPHAQPACSTVPVKYTNRSLPDSSDPATYSGTLRVWDSESVAAGAQLGFQRFVTGLLRLGLLAANCHSTQQSNTLSAAKGALHDGQSSIDSTPLPKHQSADLRIQHATRTNVELPFPLFTQYRPRSNFTQDSSSNAGSDSDSGDPVSGHASSVSHGPRSSLDSRLAWTGVGMPRKKKRAASVRRSERQHQHNDTASIEASETDGDNCPRPDSEPAYTGDTATVAATDDIAQRRAPIPPRSWKLYKHETDSPISPSSPPRFDDTTVQRNVRVYVDHSIYTDAPQPWSWMGAQLLAKGRETGFCKKLHQVLVKMLLQYGRDYEAVTAALFEATGYRFHVDHVTSRVKELLAAWEKQGLPLPQSMTKDGLIEYTLKGKKKTKWALQREQRGEQSQVDLSAAVIERPPDMPILTHNWLPVTFDFHDVQLSSTVSLHCLTMWWKDDFKYLPLVQSFYDAYHSHPVYQPLARTLTRCSEPHFLTRTNIVPLLPQPDKRNAAWVSAFPFHPSLLVLKSSGHSTVTVAALREGGVVHVKEIQLVNTAMHEDEEESREREQGEQEEGEHGEQGGGSEGGADGEESEQKMDRAAVCGEAEGESELVEEEVERRSTAATSRKRKRDDAGKTESWRDSRPLPTPAGVFATPSQLHSYLPPPPTSAVAVPTLAHRSSPSADPAVPSSLSSSSLPASAPPHSSPLDQPRSRSHMSLASLPRVKVESARPSGHTTTAAAQHSKQRRDEHLATQEADRGSRQGEQPTHNKEHWQRQKEVERERERERERAKEREVVREAEREAERQTERERARRREEEQRERMEQDEARAAADRDTRVRDGEQETRRVKQRERDREWMEREEREAARERDMDRRRGKGNTETDRDRGRDRQRDRDGRREAERDPVRSAGRAADYTSPHTPLHTSPLPASVRLTVHSSLSSDVSRRRRSRSRSRSRSRESQESGGRGSGTGRSRDVWDNQSTRGYGSPRRSPARDGGRESGVSEVEARKREVEDKIRRLMDEKRRLEVETAGEGDTRGGRDGDRERDREWERERERYRETSSSTDHSRRNHSKRYPI